MSGSILNQKRRKTFKGFTILYQLEPKLGVHTFLLEEIRYSLEDGKVVPRTTNLYGSNSLGNAIECISPEDIEMKFYKPGEYLELRKYYDPNKHQDASVRPEGD